MVADGLHGEHRTEHTIIDQFGERELVEVVELRSIR